jgi:hypothetical protein
MRRRPLRLRCVSLHPPSIGLHSVQLGIRVERRGVSVARVSASPLTA